MHGTNSTGRYGFMGPSDNSCSGDLSGETSLEPAKRFWSVRFQSDVGCMFKAYSDGDCKVKEVMTARQGVCIDLIYGPVISFKCSAVDA